MKRFRFQLLTLAFAGTALAQDVPPPPKPQDEGPSLETTMKFLQDKLPGTVNFIEYAHDDVAGTDVGTSKQSIEVSNVSANAGRCRISNHRETIADRTTINEDVEILLKHVQEITVTPLEQLMKQIIAKSGHPEISYKIDPPVFALVVMRPGGEDPFFFHDETLAHRVAKAVQHAVELCGGGSQEPF
jgi:hypothetical protein